MIQYRIELVDLMKRLNLPLRAAEIGVAEGRFSEDLLARGLDVLYMVDAWEKTGNTGDGAYENSWHSENLRTAKIKVSRFGDKAVFLKGLSHLMAVNVQDNSLGMIHIDGDHSYDGVMADLRAWVPKVIDGGIISGHDYEMRQYGVKQAVQQFAAGKPIYVMKENDPHDAGFLYIK